jgi:hypothetical protein
MKNQQDEALLKVFHLMDAEEREFFLESAQNYTAGRVAKQKPVLRLIRSGTSAPPSGALCSRLS